MKNLMLIPLLALSLIFLACATPQPTKTSNPGPKWVKLGERTVNYAVDHDEIVVTLKKGVFTALKMNVQKVGIHLINVKVVFGNGEKKNIPVGKKIKAGENTPVFDLPGNKRIIKKVIFNYKTIPNRPVKAKVVLWGRR